MKKLLFVFMIMVAGIAASAQAPPAQPQIKRYPVFMSQQEYQFIMQVIDKSNATHQEVKMAQDFIGGQWFKLRNADTTKPQVPAVKEKPKKKD